MSFSSPAEIFGVDGIIILVVVILVLFGSTQIPKLARSLGSAQQEFKKGVNEGPDVDGTEKKSVVEAAAPASVPVPAQATATVETPDSGSSYAPR